MTTRGYGRVCGYLGIALLAGCYAALIFIPMLSPNWAIALIGQGVVATIAGAVAAKWSSKWWYFLAGSGVLTVAVLLGAIGG